MHKLMDEWNDYKGDMYIVGRAIQITRRTEIRGPALVCLILSFCAMRSRLAVMFGETMRRTKTYYANRTCVAWRHRRVTRNDFFFQET